MKSTRTVEIVCGLTLMLVAVIAWAWLTIEKAADQWWEGM